MKRNENRMWFDIGYREAINDKKIESFIPRNIGLWIVLVAAYWHTPTAAVFLFLYTVFEYFQYSDLKEYRVEHEPPDMWEGDP